MKTTSQWIEEILAESAKFEHWLKRQYIGEKLAAERLSVLVEYTKTTNAPYVVTNLLTAIAKDEANHAVWIEELLNIHNIPIPEVSYDNTRYWAGTLGEDAPLDKLIAAAEDNWLGLMALGHHVETMRLARIQAIVDDERFPIGVRTTFQWILKDETRHAQWFKLLSSSDEIRAQKFTHERGLELLGLEV